MTESSLRAEEKAFTPTGLQLYYGNDSKILDTMQQRMRKGQVVVIELRNLSKEQISAIVNSSRQAGSKVLAYISIGALGHLERANFEQYLKDRNVSKTLDNMILEKNQKFEALRIDVTESIWREFLIQRIKRIYNQNVDGLFLDAVDTCDLYINRKEWPISRRAESVKVMIGLIRMIKAMAPEKFVMQNRGLNLIGKNVFVGDATGVFIPGLDLAHFHPNNPDGLLWSGAYTDSSAWIASKERDMIQIRKNGFTSVFTLGYADSAVDRKQFFQNSRAAGFIPAWGSSNMKLHEELTQEANSE
ncbi:endo alpha-1,4 polygalactosaminidase [uncultured Gimesia sp.]|uniref:endo alpha-1,4 polygalactosaminidase n=1 Tax=uncultured Gimesia sp. TaxID=1678688 RepID=UPI0030DDB8BE|tara:strand:+ start:70352 stop:71257 length:906 start_codon:yes stop_codon:yes gene_type:complete